MGRVTYTSASRPLMNNHAIAAICVPSFVRSSRIVFDRRCFPSRFEIRASKEPLKSEWGIATDSEMASAVEPRVSAVLKEFSFLLFGFRFLGIKD